MTFRLWRCFSLKSFQCGKYSFPAICRKTHPVPFRAVTQPDQCIPIAEKNPKNILPKKISLTNPSPNANKKSTTIFAKEAKNQPDFV